MEKQDAIKEMHFDAFSVDGIAYQTGLPTMELFDDTGGCKGLMEMCEKNEEMGKRVVEDGYGDVWDTRNIPPYAEANFFSIQTFGKFDQNASQSASRTSNSVIFSITGILASKANRSRTAKRG